MSNNQQRIQPKTFAFSIKDKDYSKENNVTFKTAIINHNDLVSTFKSFNYSAIQWDNGYRNQDNYLTASGLFIDIDEGTSIDNAIAILRKSNLNFVLVTSKSHTPENHRFRIFLPFDKPVIDSATYRGIAEYATTKFFTSADTSATEQARFFYGSPEDAISHEYWDGYALETSNLTGIEVQPYRPENKRSVDDAWSDTLKVRLSDESEVLATEITEKTPIFCPFHEDDAPSAFISISERSGNHFIHCSACGKTFWKEFDSIEDLCEPFWSYKTSVYEMSLAGGRFAMTELGKDKFFVKTGAMTRMQEASAFDYLVNVHHFSALHQIESLGDIAATSTYFEPKPAEGLISVHYAAIEARTADNAFIEQYLEATFGTYAGFIKQWISVYAFSNFRKLPTLIFKGGRGTGKSTFAEWLMAMYPQLSFVARDIEGSFNPYAEGKLVVIDENDSKKSVQYTTLKKLSGQEFNEVNKKYQPQYSVRNNLNTIVLSNSPTPVKMESDELQTDPRNNQFFVCTFKSLPSFDPDLKSKLIERLGHWLRTECKSVYDNLNTAGFRYTIPVPITEDEKALFLNSTTDEDAEIADFIDGFPDRARSVTDAYHKFFNAGLLPGDFIRGYAESMKISVNRIALKLRERGYLENKAPERVRITPDRFSCYVMTDKMKSLVPKAAVTTRTATSTIKKGAEAPEFNF